MAMTIYDIANRAGKSAVTVSLALQGNRRVSDATRQNILKIANELNYKPNLLARGLVGGRTKTWSFVFNFPAVDFSKDTYFVEMFSSFAEESASGGYQLLFQAGTSKRTLAEIYSEATSVGIEGIFLASQIESEEDRLVLEQTDIPTIILNREFSYEKVTCITCDDFNRAVLATEHLLELGHHRLAFVGSTTNQPQKYRFMGFEAALKKAGIKLDPNNIIESTSFNVDAGESAGLRLANLRHLPTAALVTTDLMGIGVIAGLFKKDICVPKDMSVIGFDNVHISSFFRPTLSSVGCDFNEISKVAIESLTSLITGKECGTKKVVSGKLYARESTGKVNRIAQ